MYFNILIYLVIALGILGICIALFTFCRSYIYEKLLEIFIDNDYEDQLTDEEKYKRYIEKKKKELIKHQMLVSDLARDQVEYEGNTKIINIMQPIGQWTKLVMSEKLQRFAGLKFDKEQTGFWQMFVSMKSLSQGKHRGRSK
ncbi:MULTISPECIES: hypothetical protein [Ehrlichia]|uniref:Uncharacterized protein n=1 Tax=Ehrlichia cf. muris str. EmCRT TaxID=1359167 RepID=A0A0F3NBF9_9RICK|nr:MULTISPECIES: hypothetical protein [Ehrlichia]KJV65433.1 hypothetical protein EMUCRT_0375 [Ehrlichia cf. muris str. EmCRT]OUC04620.1 hypothetical protein DB91_00200 [Ehrlichia sp. Wisconsin_h]